MFGGVSVPATYVVEPSRFAGICSNTTESIVGAVVSASVPVVNVRVALTALPNRSATEIGKMIGEIVTVNVVFAASSAYGVSVTVFRSDDSEIAQVTVVAPCVSVIVFDVTV